MNYAVVEYFVKLQNQLFETFNAPSPRGEMPASIRVSFSCPCHFKMCLETALQMASYVLQEILLKHWKGSNFSCQELQIWISFSLFPHPPSPPPSPKPWEKNVIVTYDTKEVLGIFVFYLICHLYWKIRKKSWRCNQVK